MLRRALFAVLAAIGIGAIADTIGGGFAYGVLGRAPTAPGARIIPPEGQPMAAAGQRHVLLLGTSLTVRGDWPELLQERLASCAAAGAPPVVERLARAGAASDWGMPALRARLAEAPAPDVVVIEFSGNDASLVHGLPLSTSRRNHRRMLRMVQDAGAVPILATMSPAWGWKAAARPGQRRYHALYRDLAVQTGAGLVDTIADWRALSAAARHAAVPDNLHPTPAAMAAITVPALAAALRPLVCRQPAARMTPGKEESASLDERGKTH